MTDTEMAEKRELLVQLEAEATRRFGVHQEAERDWYKAHVEARKLRDQLDEEDRRRKWLAEYLANTAQLEVAAITEGL